MQPVQQETKRAGAFAAWLEVLAVSAKLGVTSFGGPTAHIGYFYHEYVQRKKWIDDRSYADLVALCQFLPGPASSQVGIGIGVVRAGWLGGLAAWLGFTLPSAVALMVFAFLLERYDIGGAGWLHGLKLAAVAIVAHAVASMGQKLAPDRARATTALAAAAAALLWPTAATQIVIIAAAGAVGFWLYRRTAAQQAQAAIRIPVSRTAALVCLALFVGLLALLPFAAAVGQSGWLTMIDSFYRAGSLVFGGGHVVLPLLERELVPAGLAGAEAFLSGYAAAQAVPGPLFTFAAYLGALSAGAPGAAVATIAVFLPGYLLVMGALPFWSRLRGSAAVQGVLLGVNAAVVGLLLAALYDPLWTSVVRSPADFAVAAALFGMLAFWKLPPGAIVLAGAAAGTLLAFIP